MAVITSLDRELYHVSLAAAYLRVPPATLKYWLEGGSRKGFSYEPVIRERKTGSQNLTWGEFVEAWYVKQYRKVHGVEMLEIRTLIEGMRKEFGLRYPLAHRKAYVAAGKTLARKLQDEGLVSEKTSGVVRERDGQLALSPIAEQFLAEVDFDSSEFVTQILPAGESSPVRIEPDVAFGAPHVRGIRTENLAELVAAGEEIGSIADSFSLEASELRAALAYEWQATA